MRLFVVVATIVVLGVTTVAPAAGSLRVRTDPNDSTSDIDIHKVMTNLSPTTVYLRLTSWESFRIRDMRETWGFALDTVGDGRIDRWVGIDPTRHGLKCEVLGIAPRVRYLIGKRHATRPDRRSAACHLPRGWFGHIDRTVRFRASIEDPSSPSAADDAPDRGLYRWI